MNDVTKDLLEALKIVTSQLERVGDTRKHKDGEFIDLGREAIARAEASLSSSDDAPSRHPTDKDFRGLQMNDVTKDLLKAQTTVDAETVDRAWARFCGAFGDGPDAPYPGMIAAFETHYGQSFRDKEWRTEAACWAAAWSKATARAEASLSSSDDAPSRHPTDKDFRGLQMSDVTKDLLERIADISKSYKRFGDTCPMMHLSHLEEIAELAARAEAAMAEPQPDADGPWKSAVIDQLIIAHILTAEHESDPLKAIQDLLAYNSDIAVDPRVSGAAAKLVEQAKAEEREACAKVCESRQTPGTGSVAILQGAADAILARRHK